MSIGKASLSLIAMTLLLAASQAQRAGACCTKAGEHQGIAEGNSTPATICSSTPCRAKLPPAEHTVLNRSGKKHLPVRAMTQLHNVTKSSLTSFANPAIARGDAEHAGRAGAAVRVLSGIPPPLLV